ncbi:MAG: hypothetical protein HDS78_05850 [Bacteroidales bacterium]|nr:hypothetical protein [Bacteroidales bacterium]
MKEFLLIDHEPWSVRRKELFYNLFKAAGVKLQVLDLSSWLYPELTISDEIKDAPYLTKINSEKELYDFLSSKNPYNTIIVLEVIKNWKNRKIFKIISDLNFKSIKIELFGNTSITQSLKEKLTQLKFSSIYSIIKRKIESIHLNLYDKLHHIKSYSEVLSSNAISYRTTPFNHPDYERFKFVETKQIISVDYIVFCDIFFPSHPDFKYFYKVKKLPDSSKYQSIMKDFFDYLESKYKIPVVIAAHPKSDYRGNEFGDRQIIKYQTDNLIANAKMVTLHKCNSISYALLHDKPIAFIGTDDYLNLDFVRRTFPNIANKTLGLQIYNLNKTDFSDITFEKVSEPLRLTYIFNYLTSDKTQNIPNAETLRQLIAKI